MMEMRKERPPMYTGREHLSSIHEAIDRALRLYPNNVGCRYLDNNQVQSKTYLEIYQEIKYIGSFIYEKCGYAKDKVAFVTDSNYPWFISYLAALYYGCIAVPLDRLLSEEDLAKQIEFADVSTIFYNDKNSKKIQKIIQILNKEITLVCLDQKNNFSLSYDEIIASKKEIEYPKDIGPDDLAEIVFTSGTTGTSKGVMISHYNIASNLMFCTNVLDLKQTDDMISFLPNNHLYFLSTGLVIPMYFGSAVCINDSILKFKQNMNEYRPSIALMVPALLQLLKREIISLIKEQGLKLLQPGDKEASVQIKEKIRQSIGGNIDTVICGGAFLDQDTIEFYKLIGIELLQGYGISECSPLVSCSIQRHVDYSKVSTVGLIGTCCSVKIVEGELWISGANVMLGYYKNPQLTSEVMEDGWLKTGDLGYIDEDGYLYLTGRKKNLIILNNGENVCPEELENYIYSIEVVDSAIVYAENETIIVEIYPNQKLVEEKKIGELHTYLKSEIAKINQKLPLFKQIKKNKVRQTPFEMTSTMKVKR